MTPCPVSCPGTVINGMKVNVTLQPYERKVLAYVKQSDPLGTTKQTSNLFVFLNKKNGFL